MQQKDVRPGDLLLTRGGDNKWLSECIREKIKSVTGSPYTHAAIALSSTEIVDARPGGVKIRAMQELVDGADCVAVLARSDIWDAKRLQLLGEYAATLQAAGARYNYRDALAFEATKAQHQAGVTQALDDYFKQAEKGEQHAATNLGPFFCSELVVNCLIHIGFIDPSAAVVFEPGTQSPGDLLADATYGYLVGYLTKDPTYKMSDDDPLQTLTRYVDVCGPR